MSLKRKAVSSKDQGSTEKKPKFDFFAPRTSSSSGNGPTFKFDQKPENATRLTTWNVNGIKSVDEKLLKKYLEAEEPDILILTETKFSKGKPDILCLKTRFKHQTWGTDLNKPGHAGTAILSKVKPLNIIVGLPTWTDRPGETEGRFVQLEFEDLYIVGTYVPNSGENLKNMELKEQWNAALMLHLRDLDSKKPIIWAGDFNCIPSKKDLDAKAQTYWNHMSGLSEQERTGFDRILNPDDAESSGKLVHAWRHLHPEAEQYTHSSPKFGAWRLDSFIVRVFPPLEWIENDLADIKISERILEKVASCEIRNELKDLKLSDHWPVTLDLAIPV